MKARFKKAKDIKVGVVGYGGAFNMGKGHLNEMKHAGMTPIAVVEIDAARRKVAEEEFPGIETYSSVSQMLKKSEVNLVTLITPHNTHAKLALECLSAGRHVVSEKPLAITTAECDSMIKKAKQKNLMLSTYHNRHWDGCILTAKKQIQKQKLIGDIYKVEAHMGAYGQPGDWWRSSKSISGGILYDWGVHLLEYSLQLIQSEITEVSGYAKKGFWAGKTAWKKDTNEDEALATVRFKNGTWLNLCVTTLDSNPKPGQIEITGTKGSYIMTGTDYTIVQHRSGKKIVTSGKNIANKWDEYYKDISSHLSKGTKLTITPEWSRRPIHILDLANKSAKENRAIKAKYS
ncbi:MAG: dehydrogenase [Planctomycetota bacterium]|nr:MAG: dehydrogenase [Planctomycetota bacterium]